LAWSALLVPLLISCGSSTGERSSQVVATVNEREITVTQLNRALESAGVREVTPAVRQRAIETLTTEELLVQAALTHEIDRDASFVQALEQARRQLLTQFFAERMIYPKTVVTAEEIADYYNQEPLLFAKRRRFRLTTFQANAGDVTPAISAELQNVKSVDGVRGVLDAHGIKYVTELASIAPEQLPLAELEAYSTAAVGDLFVNTRPDGVVMLMSVTGIEEDVPMTLERARPMIEEYLRNSRNRAAAAEYVETARSTAKIVYTQAADAPPAGTALTQAAPPPDAGDLGARIGE
jgi:EpsD family peptidyl-prolyl cis-trans isomerase